MIRFATIGTNFIVDNFLSAALKQNDLQYAVAYSRNQATADRFADKYKAERTCTDLNELADADDVDAVYIASPNSLHYEQAALLLSHGKHVLCEKTITSNENELKSLIHLAEEHNVVLMEAMRTVYTDGFAVLSHSLPKLGTIRRVSFNYCQYSSRYDKFKTGIIENAFNPAFSNGSLMDIGVYCVHALVSLFGMPKDLKTDVLKLNNGVDGAGTILAVYDGMQAEVIYSKISDSRIPSQIQGESGTITIDRISNPQEVIFHDRKGSKQILFSTSGEPDMSGEIKEWIRLIKSGAENVHNKYSLMELQLMDEVRRQMGIVFPADHKQ